MRKALIIGGGVAGPVAAMALQRAGVEPVIYEAHPETAHDIGAFLTFAGNGITGLRLLGAAEAVEQAGFPTPQMAFRSGSGRRLGVIPLGAPSLDGAVSVTVRRSDLYAALQDEALARGIRIEHGRRLIGVDQDTDGVTARFDDGTTAAGDLLVGADGLHSRTRVALDPSAPKARYIPLLNTGGYARGVSVDAEPGIFEMVFGKRAFFGYTAAPDGSVWWFANPPRRDEPARDELAAVTDAQWRTLLLDLFADDSGPASDLIRATPGELAGWATYDLAKVPTWHSGRAVIIGDAAHATSPSSGQGASMAIEDGIVLARCVRDLPDVPSAFAAYERLRRARVQKVVTWGARSSNSKVAGPIGRTVRDLAMPKVLTWLAKQNQDWLYKYPWDWDARVAVPR
jgi:FAD-dependent urate hydroxylase